MDALSQVVNAFQEVRFAGTRTGETSDKAMATFHPQAWVRDYAVEVDPEGEVEFDVTPEVEAMGREAALALEDDSYETDDLRSAAGAPRWIRDWHGPFWVEARFSIQKFYGPQNH